MRIFFIRLRVMVNNLRVLQILKRLHIDLRINVQYIKTVIKLTNVAVLLEGIYPPDIIKIEIERNRIENKNKTLIILIQKTIKTISIVTKQSVGN